MILFSVSLDELISNTIGVVDSLYEEETRSRVGENSDHFLLKMANEGQQQNMNGDRRVQDGSF